MASFSQSGQPQQHQRPFGNSAFPSARMNNAWLEDPPRNGQPSYAHQTFQNAPPFDYGSMQENSNSYARNSQSQRHDNRQPWGARTIGSSSRPAQRRQIPEEWGQYAPSDAGDIQGQRPHLQMNGGDLQGGLYGGPFGGNMNGNSNAYANSYNGSPNDFNQQSLSAHNQNGGYTYGAMNNVPSEISSPGGAAQTPRTNSSSKSQDDELILTAIVIKNIPFALQKEQLAEKMAELGLPQPYAFNYHFEGSVFRGLAFANFQSPEDTLMVIKTMNNYVIEGRALRVEYKRMLPPDERARIELLKRFKRGQMEEQHRGPVAKASMTSLKSNYPGQSPSPVHFRKEISLGEPLFRPDSVDLNDNQILNHFRMIEIFKNDENRKILEFGPPITPKERLAIHTIAQHNGISHVTLSSHDEKYVQLYKKDNSTPAIAQASGTIHPVSLPNGERRGLSRAATTDFSDTRDAGYRSLNRQPSGLLGPSQPPGLQYQRGLGLRAAKSTGDFQRTPSPSTPSDAFTPSLAANAGWVNQLYGQTSASDLHSDYEGSMSNLSLGPSFGQGNRGTGAIGSNRPTAGQNGTQEGARGMGSIPSVTVPERQPRGPPTGSASEWSRGRRQNRGSADFDIPESSGSSRLT